jgi:hypothetical protein
VKNYLKVREICPFNFKILKFLRYTQFTSR